MPTTLPRYQITETPPVAHAINVAAVKWPDLPRSRLVIKLIETAAQALESEDAERIERRREAVRRSAGAFPGCFPPGYLEDLRKDWPE